MVDPNFKPKRYLITAITNAAEAVVTTDVAHEYVVGQIVNIRCPKEYKMIIDHVDTKVLAVTSNTFTTMIDTNNHCAFVTVTAPPPFTQAQVVPVTGEWDNDQSLF